MSATGYSSNWLEQRYVMDAKSRDESITNLFIENLPSNKILQLLDLGAGLGSNVKYMHPKISSNQNWYCVEIDPKLIQYGLNHLSKYFENLGYKVILDEQNLVAIKDNRISVNYVNHSFFDIQASQYLAFDGILGNALLDVFTPKQLTGLFKQLQTSIAPKLFSIVYEFMDWGDDDPLNDFFISIYHEHMQRSQKTGNALGPDTIKYITANIPFGPGQVILGESTWELDSSDSNILNHLLAFYQKSIPEIRTQEEDLIKFETWVNNKRDLINKHKLNAVVQHSDLLCLSRQE